MANLKYKLIETTKGVPIKAWIKGVTMEVEAEKQLINVSQLPIVYKWVAAMPDVHFGIGATVGSVIPTKGAVLLLLWRDPEHQVCPSLLKHT